MTSKNFPLFITIILLLVATGGVIIKYHESLSRTVKQEQAQTSEEKPILSWKETDFDWGKIPQNKIAEHSFVIKNTGSLPLEISKIRTSCACTTAELLLDNQTKVLPSSIPPNSGAVIKVLFDPEKMNSHGDTKRAVRVETNDPLTPFLIFNLQAYVE